MSTRALADAAEFIKSNGTSSFSPFAYYDKDLDCIRVRIKDCSMIEKRMNRIFTIVIAAHSQQQDDPVGFNIKGVRFLFNQLKLPKEGVVQLTAIIDKIVKVYPDSVAKAVQKKFRQTIKTLEVNLGKAA